MTGYKFIYGTLCPYKSPALTNVTKFWLTIERNTAEKWQYHEPSQDLEI